MLDQDDESAELSAFRTTVARFLHREAAPHHARWEEQGCVDRDFWFKAGAAGILCPAIPLGYGGGGGDIRHSVIVTEEASRLGLSGPGFRVHSDIAAFYILNHGDEEQRLRWLPKLASGELVAAIAMTEPGAGSDLQAIRTRARLDGADFVLSGSKTFITNGQLADLVIVACRTSDEPGARGLSLILVETDRPGFRKGRKLEKIGLKAQDTSELFFDEVRVPAANLLGETGKGFRYLMSELPQERLLIAAAAIATAEAALEQTIAYTRDRKAFGQAIADFQYNRFRLAQMKTDLTVGRTFLDHCVSLHMRKKLDVPTAAMCKLASTELEGRLLDACVQMHGGYGYMTEIAVARAYTDARAHRIFGGASEVMLELIARSL
jgi:acyl-CoA dehydrogenase